MGYVFFVNLCSIIPMLSDFRYCRDTQTYHMKHIRQQTSEDTSTQMTKIGVYVSNMSDKLIVPGKYTTAEQHHRMILKKVGGMGKYCQLLDYAVRYNFSYHGCNELLKFYQNLSIRHIKERNGAYYILGVFWILLITIV